ncbi:hypothetical protein CO657_22605 (plasmid) [Rhizobium acidisoli]|uniref:Lecithin:cholesterol acyltransferase n=1 Tax=Rhizobium acidisoli TaxID=1538158 RepID=A0AAE5WPG8_9HYPH|nr:hypothetical protein [Rhizobium acidisoli]QAS80840.1 hypothetical protein CO657_22605 [Rhizobium acidisoli]
MTKHPDLIVFLPGITGSVLMKDGDVIWGNSAKSLWDMVANDSLDLLEITGSDNGDDDLGDGIEATALISNIKVVPGLWKIGGYSIVSQNLVANLALEKNVNYFEFPYDWRRDNRVSARKLARFCREKLSSWRQKSGNEKAKITLVAHSMGGLVSRYFIECLEGWKETRMLISLGTPYRGSLNAVDGICNGLKKSVGGVTLADGSRAFRSFQSLYQLLPIYPVVNDGGGPLKRVYEVELPNMDLQRAIEARKFHDEILDAYAANLRDTVYVSQQVRIVPIVGIDQPTFQSARLKVDGRVELLHAYEGRDMRGDGTVPRVSAIHDDNASAAGVYFANTHAVLPNAETAMTHLKGVIQGTTIDLGKFRVSNDPGNVSINVGDVYDADGPIVISATLNAYRQNLTATFIREGDLGESKKALMYPRDGTYSCSVSLAPGQYTVNVSGDGLHTAGDVFVVVGAVEERLS